MKILVLKVLKKFQLDLEGVESTPPPNPYGIKMVPVIKNICTGLYDSHRLIYDDSKPRGYLLGVV